jgi:CsoR family transcriptional regulator, copper-sensing transcriptional repressor
MTEPEMTPPATPEDPKAPIACGCAAGLPEEGAEGRRAAAVDPEAKQRNVKRLRRIEGQVRGLQKMVNEERYCADIMTQIASVQEALRSVGRELMRNHLKHCATRAIRNGAEDAQAMYDELIDLMYKNIR